jgi:RimJ/RimL family protein N-acetyltransferase
MPESRPVPPVREPILFSERLRLRPVTVDDAAAVQSYRGRDDVVRYLTHEPLTLEASQARLRVAVEHWRRYPAEWFNANFAAELLERASDNDGAGDSASANVSVSSGASGRVIGDLRAWNLQLDASGPATESPDVFWIGYALHPEMQGQGYAREAAARMIRWLFDERSARELRAIAWTPNTASISLLEKLGFRIFLELPAEAEEHSKKLPAVHLRLTRSEWAAAQAETRRSATKRSYPQQGSTHQQHTREKTEES